jgi:hypothetical protein
MKFIAALSLLASASAFAPYTVKQSSSALKSYENELGVIDPTGFFGK